MTVAEAGLEMLVALKAIVRSRITCACPVAYGATDQEKVPHVFGCPIPAVYAAIRKAEKGENEPLPRKER